MTTELPYDLAPPFGDKRVVAARSYRPIDLRRYVIDRVFLYPCHRIAEDIVVRPIGTYRGRSNAVSLGYRGIGAPYTGGRDIAHKAFPIESFGRPERSVYLHSDAANRPGRGCRDWIAGITRRPCRRLSPTCRNSHRRQHRRCRSFVRLLE